MLHSTAVWARSGRHYAVKRVQQNSALPLHDVLFLLQPVGANLWKHRERPKVNPKLLHDKTKQFNPLKLTPLLPSVSPFPRKHTHIQIGVVSKKSVVKKERKKVSIIFLSCRVLFSYNISYSHIFLSLHTEDVMSH